MEVLVNLTNCSALAARGAILHAISETIHQSVDKSPKFLTTKEFSSHLTSNESRNVKNTSHCNLQLNATSYDTIDLENQDKALARVEKMHNRIYQ